MESIKGHPEYVETVFGEAIVARDESLVVLAGACGLGPPDLCWLQKAPKSALTGASGEAKGYYHCCLGVDASSSAAVAAYFATLTSLVEPPTFLQGLFSTTETRIDRGFYCCFDPLTRLDVRCELCIPGGVVCGALDCEGNVHDVTPDLWRNCVVATFLRSELYDAELVSYSGVPVARHPPLPTPADESRLLSAVMGLYEDGVLPEALEALTVDQAGGVAPEHADVVLHTLLHYFSKRQRWGTALDFFARLSVTYPASALYVAAVQRECGLYDDALATLYRTVDEVPDDPLLLAALATECLYSDQVEASLRFATRAARLRPLLRPAWLALARAHVRLGSGPAALVVLNLVPPPPLPGREETMLHVVVPPDPKSVTKPAVPSYDLDVALVRQSLAEEAIVHPLNAASSGAAAAAGALGSPSSLPALPILPGSLMVPREPPDAAPAPDTAPLRVTKAVLAAVYTVLQELVAVSGWDGFLRLRSSVFVMHADSDVLREQQREADERERQLQLLHRQLSATLPPSPGWGPAPAVEVAAAASKRPPPEVVDFQAALGEATVMGLAEYPEHLEDDYNDPRVAAAREAHRRHLREIAERQAQLEAAEGGEYADDEWDGSSPGSGGGGGAADGGGGGAAGGGGRSSTGRSRRDRGKAGRRTPGRRGRGAGAALQRRVEAEAEDAAEAAAARGGGDAAGAGAGGGVVDAGELVRQEEEADKQQGQQVQERIQAQQRRQQQEPVGGGGVAVGGNDSKAANPPAAAAAAAAAPAAAAAADAPSSSNTGWWGTFFGGGGAAAGGGGGAAPQRREAGPLGEACEDEACGRPPLPPWRTVGAAVSELIPPPGDGDGGGCGLRDPAPSCSGRSSWRCACGGAERPERPHTAAEWDVGVQGRGDTWWDPAPAPAQAAVAVAVAAPGIVLCSPLQPLVPTPTRQQQQHERGPSTAPAHSPCLAAAAAAAATSSSGGRRCRQPAGGWCSSSSAAAAVLGGSPLCLARGLLRLLVCRLKGRPGSHQWRQRQRRLQRALLLAAAAPPQGLLPYGPQASLLSAPGRPRPHSGGGGGYRPAGSVVAAAATAVAGCLAGLCGGSCGARSGRGCSGGGGAIQRYGPGPVAESGGADGAAGAGGTPTVAPAALGGGAAVAPYGAVDEGGFPLMLQNHDADRQMVLEGLDVTELGAKRLCARWLDELIVALWHDLQAFLDWKALDSELAEAGFQNHADIVAGNAPAPTAADYQRASRASGGGGGGRRSDGTGEPTAPPPLPTLSSLEWLRRGLLAERLHHETDALAAYQAAVMTPPPAVGAAAGGGGAVFGALSGGGPGAFSMIAWQAIMRLAPAADPRDTAWALRAAQAVMTWLEARSPPGVGAVPFTSGFLTAGSAAGGGGGGSAGATRAAPATAAAAAAAAGGKLQACPLAVVQCLHLVAAALGDAGVESTLAAPSAAAAAAAKSAASGGAGGGGTAAVHPAAAAVLRHAVQSAEAARARSTVDGGS